MSSNNNHNENDDRTSNLNNNNNNNNNNNKKPSIAWIEDDEDINSNDVNNHRMSMDSYNGTSDNHTNLDVQHHVNRRSSFLYKNDEKDSHHSPRPGSRSSSFSMERIEEKIVTPFAQVMQTLGSIRDNFVILTKLQIDKRRGSLGGAAAAAHVVPRMFHTDKNYRKLALDTLQNFDWCLEQLQSLQVHKSVSNMASSKFRKLLAQELTHFSDASKSGTQVSQYLSKTFLTSDENETDMDVSSQDGKSKIQELSQITVKKSPRIPQMSKPVSRFGVNDVDERALSKCMKKIDQWGLEVFEVNQLTNGRPLTCVTYMILQKRNFLETFKIPVPTLLRYIGTVEKHYRKENYYHNNIHAADVAQSVHVLLSSPVLSSVFTDLEILAAIFAGAIHDVNHPGLNNQFLIQTMSELAIIYNDVSVLENHHLAMAFKLLQNDGCDIFANLSKKERQSLRKMVIDMVLATDMSKHMSLLADLRTMVEAHKFSKGISLSINNYSDRIKILQCCVHCADLSNPTKPLHLYKEWVKRVLEECWCQGDKERNLGLAVSPMMDRHSVSVEKSQVGFIDFIVQPLWETWADLVYPDANKILDALQENRDYFNSKILTSPSMEQTTKDVPQVDNLEKESLNDNDTNIKFTFTGSSNNDDSETISNDELDDESTENDKTSNESRRMESDTIVSKTESSITYHLSDEVIQRLRRLSNDALHDVEDCDETGDFYVEESAAT